jgi:hypothetical protein
MAEMVDYSNYCSNYGVIGMKHTRTFCLVMGGLLATFVFFLKPILADTTMSCSKAGQDLSITPPHQIGMYLDGYHSYRREAKLAGEEQKQIRTAHFCKQVNPDLYQCLIYDGNSKDARLIGVEYVITKRLYDTLPKTEKKYWHTHDAEVDSGLLTLPGMSKEQQTAILTCLRSTYGKTWQTWNQLESNVPLGEPALMWNVDPKKVNQTTKRSVAAREINPTF